METMTKHQRARYGELIAELEAKPWLGDFERDMLAIYKRMCGEYEGAGRIRNAVELKHALSRLDGVWGANEGTPEFKTRKNLICRITEYENENCRIGPPTPYEAARFRADQETGD